MSIHKLTYLCFWLLYLATPVLAHDDELHVSDLEKLVSGIGALILALALLSLLFRKKNEELPPE